MKLVGSKQKKKIQEESVGQLHVYSYKLLNEYVKFMHPKLSSLEKSIKQAMMPIPFEVYVSSMVFFSMIAGICGIVMGAIAAQFINIQDKHGEIRQGLQADFVLVSASLEVKQTWIKGESL